MLNRISLIIINSFNYIDGGFWREREESINYLIYIFLLLSSRDPNSGDTPVDWPLYKPMERQYLNFDFELSVNKDFHVEATKIFQPELRELFVNDREEL